MSDLPNFFSWMTQSRGVTVKGGAGSGRYPKGSGDNPNISFGDTPAKGAQAQALGDRIVVDKKSYAGMNDEARLALVAHEHAHNKIENRILEDNNEWNKASEALLVTERNGRQLFVSGETRIGEAVVNVIASRVVGSKKPEAYSDEKWGKAMDWADHVIGKYGGGNFVQDVHKQKKELDRQL